MIVSKRGLFRVSLRKNMKVEPMNPMIDRMINGENPDWLAISIINGITRVPSNPIAIMIPNAWLLISVGNNSEL